MSNSSKVSPEKFNVAYQVDFSNFGQNHLFRVEAKFNVTGKSELEVFLPVWTPGSYLIREYARHLETVSVRSESGTADCSIHKIRKNAWRVTWSGEPDHISVDYQLYAREKSVRTNWVERSYAFIVGSGTFLSTKEYLHDEHAIKLINIPQDFIVDCSLSKREHGKEIASFVAKDFDDLVDSPILVGDLTVDTFEVGGKSHRLVSAGNLKAWDHAIAAKHSEAIVKAVQEFWGDVPYEEYSFQNLVLGGYGGLEHDNCCVLMSDPHAMLNRSNYVDWLGLVSHEFFHTWNVRRLRPKVLRNYDYENEQYTRELWIAEGITSYFDDLLVLRAGLCSESEFLTRLSKTVTTVMNAPGRNVQSLEDSSFDTWIKHYRPDENTNNSRISYYTKGACVAWLLDVMLAKLSGYSVRLDDVMRQLWKRYSRSGYTNQDFEELVNEMVPYDWADWFDTHVRGVTELDFSQALDFLGLKLKANSDIEKRSTLQVAIAVPEASPTQSVVELATLGCEVRDAGGRIIVDRILRGSTASGIDLQVDDEILAINDVRTTFASLSKVLQYYRTGQQVEIAIVRRELMRAINLVLDKPSQEWKLEVSSGATESTAQTRNRWLSGK